MKLFLVCISKIKKEDLLNEVVNEFTKIRASIINHTQDRNYLLEVIKRSTIQIYASQKEDEEVADGMLTIGDGKEPQPLEW